MTAHPMMVTHKRGRIADYSVPILYDERAIAYKRPQPESDLLGFVKPYTALVTSKILNVLSSLLVNPFIFPQDTTFVIRLGSKLYRLPSKYINVKYLWG